MTQQTVLGIDPSTTATGVALVRGATVLAWSEFRGAECPGLRKSDHTLEARFRRIRWIRREFTAWLHAQTHAIDLIAYETPFVRGDAAGAAIHQTIGGLITIGILDGIEVRLVRQHEAKASVGKWAPKRTTTSADRAQASAEGKLQVIAAVNLLYKLDLDMSQDAVADAIATARAAGQKEDAGLVPRTSALSVAMAERHG
jgi:Holliday junction resolvasome RuvABC endonuclease subunit